MKEFRVREVCTACNGTGLYVGMAERDGAAVICHKCKGTGCHEFVHQYEEFTVRNDRKGIKRVFECNPGIGIGKGDICKLEDFGGMPFKEWEAGLPFKRGMEMRKYSCPSWWYQCSNYKLKPEWEECYSAFGGPFSSCKYFKTKEKCWERFDKENPE